jgi:hypothetical protein
MIVAGTSSKRIAAKVISKTTGSVTSGIAALRRWSRKTRMTRATTATSSPSARSSVRSTRLARSRRIVGRHQLHPAGQPCPQPVERPADVPDDRGEIGPALRDHDAADGERQAVQVRQAVRHGVAGQADTGHVLDPNSRGRRGRAGRRRHGERVDRAEAADRSGRRRRPHRRDHVAESQAARLELAAAGLDDHLLRLAPERGHLDDAGDRRQRRTDHVVLQPPQPRRLLSVGWVDQHILEHPARARRLGPDADPDGRRERRPDPGDAVDDGLPPGGQTRRRSKTTSTYAMPDIDDPRTALAPGTASSARVSLVVTSAATSAAGWPIHSATRTICASDTSGITSRGNVRRASSPPSAASNAARMTTR